MIYQTALFALTFRELFYQGISTIEKLIFRKIQRILPYNRTYCTTQINSGRKKYTVNYYIYQCCVSTELLSR